MGHSAQLEMLPENDGFGAGEPVLLGETARPSALKQEVAERLAAHRQRRAHAQGTQAGLDTSAAVPSPRAAMRKNKIAAAVAERYAQTPSYRAFLAAEAQRAVEQAAAAAAVAARNAEALAAVQTELLAELELWDAPQEFTPATAQVLEAQKPAPADAAPVIPAVLAVTAEPAASLPARTVASGAALTVRLYEEIGRTPAQPQAMAVNKAPETASSFEETRALDEEIAFRQAPVFDDFGIILGEPEAIPANLLEFPRQLVAAKKARPRLAEGPLREDAPRSPQLRIFEVEPEQISTVPEPEAPAPVWHSIVLDAHSMTEPMAERPHLAAAEAPPIRTAPLELRAMAAALDAGLILAGFLAFVAVYLKLDGPLALGVPMAAAAIGILGALGLTYQLLFFALADQTPGMRYARIGLCTFADENPSRASMRKRVLLQLCALLPLGLGYLWSLVDEDRLGWHDRLSKMYQRAY